MDPTWVVVRNAFHRITQKIKSEGACMQTRWKEPTVLLFKRLVSVAPDETITTYNKEIHTTLNCAPDQDYRTEDVPSTSSARLFLHHLTVTSTDVLFQIDWCFISRFLKMLFFP